MAAELRKRGAAISSNVSPINDSIKESVAFTTIPASKKIRSYLVFVIASFYITLFLFVWWAHRQLPAVKTKSESALNEFSEERARKHLDIITSFGPRPTGSHACEVQAVYYILTELQDIKSQANKDFVLEIDVQRPTGSFNLDFLDSLTSYYHNVTNIVVRISPKKNFPPQHAVLVNAHFDSVPGSPGASDDAVSCATMLEVLRCLTQSDSDEIKHGIIFLFNGAEENILQASHGFITQHKWVKTVKAFVNLEAAGAGGREILFQAGPEHPWLIKTYTESAKYPFAQAVGQEVFQSGIIPSDTDFRIYRDFGQIPGIDIAYISNGYVYHTKYDTPAAVTPGSVQRAGENLLAVLKGLANSPFLVHPGEYKHGAVVFFDIIGLFMVHYPERLGVVINGIVIVLSLICIISKVQLVQTQKIGKGKESMPQSKLSPLSIPLTTLVLLLSWVFAFLPPVLVSLIVTHADRSLSWYCRPYLGAMLYGIPALMGLMLVHCLLRMLYISKIDPSETKEADNILVKKETEVFYTMLLMWTILLLIMTYYRFTSAYFPMFCVASPLLIRVVIWDRILQRNNPLQEINMKFVTVYFASISVPIVFLFYLIICNLEVFLPIMGRSGSETVPDVFIACFFAAAAVLLTSYTVSLVYTLESIKLPSAILGVVFIGSLVVTLCGLSFPYSAVHQCPKRVFFQHISRVFHDASGRVIKQDSGVWINPLDYLGLEPMVKHFPRLKEAKHPATDGVYGGFPYYVPIRNLANASWYLPGEPPEVSSPFEVKLVSRDEHQSIHKLKFTIIGSDHMTVYISPAAGVDLVASSIGNLMPVEDIRDSYDRPCYFIFYSHGVSTDPWNFWIEVQAEKPMKKGSALMEIAAAAHFIHGKDSKSPLLKEISRDLPDWVFANTWVALYKSWNFDM